MNTAPSESTAAALMSSNTSSDVDEPIVIVEYDPAWPWLFEAERERVQSALGDVATCIEHFGSTAVPGMAGKPIVDLLVCVSGLESVSQPMPSLERLG